MVLAWLVPRATSTQQGSQNTARGSPSASAGRECAKECNWQCYLNRYIDLQRTYGAKNTAEAKFHYDSHGRKEGRDCTCPASGLGMPRPLRDVT